MSQFIDRRPNNRHKNAVNRQRFLRRFKNQLKKAVSNAISSGNITDIERDENVKIPAKDILEPSFQFGAGGSREMILPGNHDYVVGDKLKKPKSAQKKDGSGGAGNSESENQDDFNFQLSQEEFLELFFEDLALPNLIKTNLKKQKTETMRRAGFTSEGVPSNINIVRSLRGALGRRLAMAGNSGKQLKALEEELLALEKQDTTQNYPPPNSKLILDLQHRIERLKKKINSIPFIDPIDLRYNHRVQKPEPSTQAVMFCLMDVSGSMDEMKKDIAKRFFILLYLFLTRTYETIELVFIRHHTSAKEVSEREFFYSRETGGTVVSSALEMMRDIIQARYSPDEWNIYGAQASDGDNWNNDSPRCHDILKRDILPFVQYFAYVEIMPRHHQSLWEAYSRLKESGQNFAMQHITDVQGIYPVFRSLFKRNPNQIFKQRVLP